MLVFHNQLWHKEDFVIYKENTEVSIGVVRGYGLLKKTYIFTDVYHTKRKYFEREIV